MVDGGWPTCEVLLNSALCPPFSAIDHHASAIWEPIINGENFNERDPAEKRNIFQAMRMTAGDEDVPYWTGLLTEWGWTNRKKREDLALLAVDALGKLGTAAALAALDIGAKKGTAAVKQACATAIANASRHHRTA